MHAGRLKPRENDEDAPDAEKNTADDPDERHKVLQAKRIKEGRNPDGNKKRNRGSHMPFIFKKFVKIATDGGIGIPKRYKTEGAKDKQNGSGERGDEAGNGIWRDGR